MIVMKVKKSIFLFLALLLPIVTFLFLKFFGKNEFAVEPLFQTSVQVPTECNGINYSTPYTISDSVLLNLQGEKDNTVTVVIFQGSGIANQQEQSIQLTRIFKEFSHDRLGVIKISSDTAVSKTKQEDLRLQEVYVKDADAKALHTCVFLLGVVYDAVLVDTENRIMGQYALNNREDADRLIVELKILLKKY